MEAIKLFDSGNFTGSQFAELVAEIEKKKATFQKCIMTHIVREANRLRRRKLLLYYFICWFLVRFFC